MGQTIAEALKEEDALRNSQENIRELLGEKFGPLPAELEQWIATTTDVSRLKAALRQVLRISALDELQL